MDRIMSEKEVQDRLHSVAALDHQGSASGEIRGFSVDAMRYVCSALKVEPGARGKRRGRTSSPA